MTYPIGKVVPNIWRTEVGWRVFVRTPDPETGKSKLSPKRFRDDGRPEHEQLEDLKDFRDGAKLTARQVRRDRHRLATTAEPDFTADAERYLAMDVVKKMPSYGDRCVKIGRWVAVFSDRIRRTITAPEIEAQLHGFSSQGFSNATVNHHRTALMSLWTRLDGRSASNPVKDTATFEEAEMLPRGQKYELLVRILEQVSDTDGVIDRARLYREVWRHPVRVVAPRYKMSDSFLHRVCRALDVPTPPRGYWARPKSARRARPALPPRRGAGAVQYRVPFAALCRARLEVLAWTGMEPLQLQRMDPVTHLSLTEKWYVTPARRKGGRPRRTPRPVIRKPLSDEAAQAFQRLSELQGWGTFKTGALRRVWVRATRALERQLRKEYGDPAFRLPHIRLKDIRHSYGTALFEKVAKDRGSKEAAAEIVGQMLDHAPGSPMPWRYALAAVPSVLQSHVKRFPQRTKADRLKHAAR